MEHAFLGNKVVADIMSRDVLSVSEEKPLNLAEVLAEAKHVRHLPVVREGKLVGMLSSRDIVRHLSIAGASHFVPVKELMSEHVTSVRPGTSLGELVETMVDEDLSALPVVENGELVGIVTERDFLKLFLTVD